jgi:hypothetical protein
MNCVDAVFLTGIILFYLYMMDQAIGGIVFRLRLYFNKICFYHGQKRYITSPHTCWAVCDGCTEDKKKRHAAKIAALEERRKRVTGQ